MSLNSIDPSPPPPPLNLDEWPSAPPRPPTTYPWTISSEIATTPVSPSLPSDVDLINKAVAHRALLVAKAKERRFAAEVAHLRYSEFDWSIPVEDFGKRCFVKDMGCKGVSIKKFARHMKTVAHLQWDETMRLRKQSSMFKWTGPWGPKTSSLEAPLTIGDERDPPSPRPAKRQKKVTDMPSAQSTKDQKTGPLDKYFKTNQA
ncbi:unnamed protein product [Clonostachys rosea f. rosea IK726]|uniref:Uncharacterized protein n=1 Tax=Clonostachys rosea f. rosea IK726 TaxID=1349383 RepID=A0ACA9TKU0_BIOOC|nr:unnamed protein product [Clonostachys rosea f. rosea IK726]